MKEIREISDRYSLYLIEDCAQAHGTWYGEKKVGSFGDIASFSFYPTKTLGGYGDAGAFVKNVERIAKKITSLRFYGMVKLTFLR